MLIEGGATAEGGAVQNHKLGVVMALAAGVCVAGVAALVKWTAGQGVPILEILFYRSLFAFVPVGIYVWRTDGWGNLRTARPMGHLVRSSVGIAGSICAFAAVAALPLTNAAGLSFTAPLFMTALSAILLREAVGAHRWVAAGLGFVGVLVMTSPDLGGLNLRGTLLALGGALGAAGAMIAIRTIGRTERSSTIVFYFTVLGLVVGGVGMAFGYQALTLETAIALVLAGLLGGTGQLLLTGAIRRAPVGVIAPFEYTQLIWSAVISYLVWEHAPGPMVILGSLIIAVCGGYILMRERRNGA